jgi:alpha-D-xyloside xylohydrolase
MMRALVMDFRADARARDISDEYMFGPAFLISPVTTYKARSRPVYLPSGTDWYDFWTGALRHGGQSLEAPAPYDSVPLYVRSGSIIPFGPEIQYTTERKSDPITVFVYQGSNGAFTLYEDDGVTYAYEKGTFARIPIHWDDAAKTLTLGKREGAFPGMLAERTFTVVFISKQKPVGFSFTPHAQRTVSYSGDKVAVKLD